MITTFLPNQPDPWSGLSPFIDADEPVAMGGNGQGYNDLAGRVEVPTPANGPGIAVIVIAGQSYGDNMPLTDPGWADSIYSPVHASQVLQLDVYNGLYYQATDPMLSLTGVGGTMWTRLGDDLIDSGQYSQVVFVPVDVGGSSINSWSPIDPTTGLPGTNLNKLETALSDLQQDGLSPTQFIWEQGIADAPTMAPTRYQTQLNQLTDTLRDHDMSALIYVATNSVAFGASSTQTDQSRAFATAQQSESLGSASVSNVYQGVDFDQLPGSDYSVDGHFTTQGLDDAAQQWSSILIAPPVMQTLDKSTLVDEAPVEFSQIPQQPDPQDGTYPATPSLADKLAASGMPQLAPATDFAGVVHFSN